MTFTTEAVWAIRKLEVFDENGVTAPETRTRDRFGWYAGLEVQPWRRWALGVRYDDSQFALMPGREWAVQPYLTFAVSDTQYVVTFGVMLAVGLLISTLATLVRDQAAAARLRESRTQVLYSVSRDLAAMRRRGADSVRKPLPSSGR